MSILAVWVAEAVSVLGTASVGWLRSEVEMARIIDAPRGAPQWVSAPALFGPRRPSTRDALDHAQAGGAPVHPPASTGPIRQSSRRVVDEADSIARQRLSPGEWHRVGLQDFEKPRDDQPFEEAL